MIEVAAIRTVEADVRKKPNAATYVTVKELADRSGVHVNTVYYWISQGLLKAERAGLSPRSPIRIPIAEADRVLALVAEEGIQ